MEAKPTREIWSVLIVCMAELLPALTISTLGIVLPEIRGAFRLSSVQAGALFSVTFGVAAVASLLGGRLADQIGRKPILIVGTSALALGFGTAGLSQDYLLMLALLVLAGVGYGFTSTAAYALLSDLLPGQRGLATALVSISYGTGAFAGPLLAGFITAAAGWRASFFTTGAFGIALTGLVYVGARSSAGHRRLERARTLRKAVNRNLVLLALAELSAGMMSWSMNAWAPTVLRSAKGLSLGETGLVMGLWGGIQIAGALLLGTLSDRLGRKAIILWTAYPAALAALIVFRYLSAAGALALGFTLLGLLRSTFPTLVVALAQDSADAEAVGAASGIIIAMHYAAAVLAPLLTAQLLTATGDIIWGMVAATSLPLLLYGALVALVRERPRARSLEGRR